jgi:hypothetical protein
VPALAVSRFRRRERERRGGFHLIQRVLGAHPRPGRCRICSTLASLGLAKPSLTPAPTDKARLRREWTLVIPGKRAT